MKRYTITVCFSSREPMTFTCSDYKDAIQFRAYYNLRKKAKRNYMNITNVSMETFVI